MLWWAIILILLALVLFIIEIFVPSGGVIGTLSAAALVGGVICLFKFDTTWGLIGAVIAALATPLAVAAALQIFPKTYVGRKMTLTDSQPTGDQVVLNPVRDLDPAALLGQTGVTLSPLRPVGSCRFGDLRLECVAESGMLDSGAPVVICAVDGMTVKVRPA